MEIMVTTNYTFTPSKIFQLLPPLCCFRNDYCNDYFVQRQLFAIEKIGYYWYLNICKYKLDSRYETSRQNKIEENLNIVKVLILMRRFFRFMLLETLAGG